MKTEESTLKGSFGGGNAVSMPFTALAKIRKKLPKTNGGNGSGKPIQEPEPDLDALVVKVKPQKVSISDVKAESRKQMEIVFCNASDYFKICERIADLQSVDGIELTVQFRELRELMAEKESKDRALARQPKGVKDQFAVDLFICEIDNFVPRSADDILSMFNRVLEMGRARIPTREDREARRKTGKWPTDYAYFRSGDGHYTLLHILSVMPGREGTISGADKRIFKSLRALVHRFVSFSREKAEKTLAEDQKRIADIRARHGLPLRLIADGKEGYYTLYLPAQPERPDGWGEGAGVVQVVDLNKDKNGAFPFLVIRAEDGAGSLKSWREVDKGKWVAIPTYRIYLRDKNISDAVSEEHRAFVLDACRKIYVATGYAISQEKEKPEKEKPE